MAAAARTTTAAAPAVPQGIPMRPSLSAFLAEFPAGYDERTGAAAVLGSGTYGVVYGSGALHAVKVQRCSIAARPASLDAAVLELDRHATLQHPCLVRATVWAYGRLTEWPAGPEWAPLLPPAVHHHRRHHGAAAEPDPPADPSDIIIVFAMPRGTPVADALAGGQVNLERVATDMLSALTYMHARGIAHGDLKPANLTWTGACAALLDLGLAKAAVRADDGRQYITGVRGSPAFLDPEYSASQANAMESELYDAARTLYALASGDNPPAGVLYSFACATSAAGAAHTVSGTVTSRRLADLITAMRGELPQVASGHALAEDGSIVQPALWQRAPAANLLLQAVRSGVARPTWLTRVPPLPAPPLPVVHDPRCSTQHERMLRWAVRVAGSADMHARAVFLGIHTAHRALPLVPAPAGAEDGAHVDVAATSSLFADASCDALHTMHAQRAAAAAEAAHLYTLGAACLHLAAIVSNDGQYRGSLATWADALAAEGVLSGGTSSLIALSEQVLRVVAALRCHVMTLTYWDWAPDASLLPSLLRDALACSYDAATMRQVDEAYAGDARAAHVQWTAAAAGTQPPRATKDVPANALLRAARNVDGMDSSATTLSAAAAAAPGVGAARTAGLPVVPLPAASLAAPALAPIIVMWASVWSSVEPSLPEPSGVLAHSPARAAADASDDDALALAAASWAASCPPPAPMPVADARALDGTWARRCEAAAEHLQYHMGHLTVLMRNRGVLAQLPWHAALVTLTVLVLQSAEWADALDVLAPAWRTLRTVDLLVFGWHPFRMIQAASPTDADLVV